MYVQDKTRVIVNIISELILKKKVNLISENDITCEQKWLVCLYLYKIYPKFGNLVLYVSSTEFVLINGLFME